ncbi:hypothetical protein D1007_28090 [Hordeum vulgare]|nr:hypothetical protein D1007_28090 [Hordeum vulgare]
MVAVQAALCLALYAAFNLGEPQLQPRGGDALGVGGGRRGGGGVSFLSVAGVRLCPGSAPAGVEVMIV